MKSAAVRFLAMALTAKTITSSDLSSNGRCYKCSTLPWWCVISISCSCYSLFEPLKLQWGETDELLCIHYTALKQEVECAVTVRLDGAWLNLSFKTCRLSIEQSYSNQFCFFCPPLIIYYENPHRRERLRRYYPLLMIRSISLIHWEEEQQQQQYHQTNYPNNGASH